MPVYPPTMKIRLPATRRRLHTTRIILRAVTIMPFIVMTGMHWAFLPTALLALADPGYEMMLIPAMLCSNTAQAGATFGVAFKTKDQAMKQIAFPAGISALLAGVTEPAMYGVTLKLKKPMVAACIATA